MQLIKPSQISDEIMTLIEEADQRVILISPYFKISKWYKLLNRLEALKQKNIDVEIYVREGEHQSIQEVMEIGFRPLTIPNLHTKLYINEKDVIVSSMNLLLSSDTNSLDIALKTENKKEYDDLFGYYTRYIKNNGGKPQAPFKQSYQWRDELEKRLLEALGKEANIVESDGKLQIDTSNRYETFIANGKNNCLRISGFLSGKEFEYASKNKSVFQSFKMQIDFSEGKKGYYDMVWGTLNGFKSQSIHDLHQGEEEVIVVAIVKFITGIEEFKKMVR